MDAKSVHSLNTVFDKCFGHHLSTRTIEFDESTLARVAHINAALYLACLLAGDEARAGLIVASQNEYLHQRRRSVHECFELCALLVTLEVTLIGIPLEQTQLVRVVGVGVELEGECVGLMLLDLLGDGSQQGEELVALALVQLGIDDESENHGDGDKMDSALQ